MKENTVSLFLHLRNNMRPIIFFRQNIFISTLIAYHFQKWQMKIVATSKRHTDGQRLVCSVNIDVWISTSREKRTGEKKRKENSYK